MEGKIKIAIAGLGNCASSLVQGIEYYKKNDTPEGLMHQRVGPYAVADISVVAVFDVDKRKVGRDVADAVFSEPNCTKKLSDVPKTGVLVARGPVLDGIAEHMRDVFLVDESQKEADVANILRITGAQ
ncbi:MAG TPA: inositol-3-phosphate synthase, partial [Candidatus Paceibacterota bacterium]